MLLPLSLHCITFLMIRINAVRVLVTTLAQPLQTEFWSQQHDKGSLGNMVPWPSVTIITGVMMAEQLEHHLQRT